MNGIIAVPVAAGSTPATITRSATMPANGCVRPHHSCPNAKARLMPPSPRPVCVFKVLRNNPID